MAERGGEPGAGFRRRRPLPLEEARVAGVPGDGRGAGDLVRGFELVRVTTSYIVQTLQMVSPDPQIIVVAPGAEPESTQVQRTEDGETIIRIFWVGPKGELLRRTPMSSVTQVGLERRFPPCASLPGQAQPRRGPTPGAAGSPHGPHLAAAAATPRFPRGTGGRSGSGCGTRRCGTRCLLRLLGQVSAAGPARARGFPPPLQSTVELGDPPPRDPRQDTCALTLTPVA